MESAATLREDDSGGHADELPRIVVGVADARTIATMQGRLHAKERPTEAHDIQG